MSTPKINWRTATDAEKNTCFAQYVAELDIGWGEVLTLEPDKHGEPEIVDHQPIPDYLHSADAVLPWLEKGNWEKTRGGTISVRGFIRTNIWQVSNAKSFPEAAMIALLRANGVEVIT